MLDQENILYYIVATSFVMPILMAALLVWFFVKFQKRKNQHEIDIRDAEIHKQKLLLEKQQAMEAERTRIAGEMHDDLGGGLTTIRFLSQKVLKNIKNEANRSNIKKIVNHTQNLVTNMSEIIWAMNAGFDTLDSLIAYTRRYANEYLVENDLKLEFKTIGKNQNHQFTGEKRRHIFLVIKEALHNIVKHADANKVDIKFKADNHLIIFIKDYGKGINEENKMGNGLKNMKNRIRKLGGKIEFANKNGTAIKIVIPIRNN